MIGIKFDEEKVKNYIQAYKDGHGKYPYLLMNEKTYKILPYEATTITTNGSIYTTTTNIILTPQEITVDGTKYVREDKCKRKTLFWENCKVMIDNDLEFGEVHIG